MKRSIALVMAVMMVLGLGALAWGDTPPPQTVTKPVEVIIDGDAFFDENQGWGDWLDVETDQPLNPQTLLGAPATVGHYYKLDQVTGKANHDVCVNVCIDGPFTDSVTGLALKTSFYVDGAGLPEVPAGGHCEKLEFKHATTGGTFGFEIEVDVHRNGWADHAGTYTVTITYEFVDC